MKVVILAPYPPYPPHGGGQQRMYQLIRQLGPQHILHLVTFSPNQQASRALAALHPFCRVTIVPAPTRTTAQRLATTLTSSLPDMLWRGYAPTFARTLCYVLDTEQYDLVQAESIEMTQYAPHRSPADPWDDPLWVYDSWNVEYMIQRRAFLTDLRQPRHWPRAGYSLLQWAKLRHYERRLHTRFRGAFAVSAGDQALLQRLNPHLHTAVVANGVDTNYFRPQPTTAPTSNILFTGTLDYRPNVDAIRWFADLVWPHIRAQAPTARLMIVGRNAGAELQALGAQASIQVVGEVADIRPFFQTARVYVVPMRIGGGVRLKVLEAFAQGVPVVATTLGMDGIAGLQPKVHALIADEPHEFAQAVVQLLTDDGLAQELAHQARLLAVQRYDWSTLIPSMATAWAAWHAKTAHALLR